MGRNKNLNYKNNLAHDEVTGRWHVRKKVKGKILKRSFRTRDEALLFVDSLGVRELKLPPVRFDETEMRKHLEALLRSVKKRAVRNNVECTLTLRQLLAMVRQFGGRCSISGIPYSFGKPEGVKRRPWIPSVDRIKPGGPYTLENCRLVCSAVNTAMNEWGTDALYRIADSMLLGEYYTSRVQQLKEK